MHISLYREKHKAPTHKQYSNFPNVSLLISQNCTILNGPGKQKPSEIWFVVCAWVCLYICMCDVCVVYACICMKLYVSVSIYSGQRKIWSALLYPAQLFSCLIPWRYGISLILVLGWWATSPKYPSVSGLRSCDGVDMCVHFQHLNERYGLDSCPYQTANTLSHVFTFTPENNVLNK